MPNSGNARACLLAGLAVVSPIAALHAQAAPAPAASPTSAGTADADSGAIVVTGHAHPPA